MASFITDAPALLTISMLLANIHWGYPFISKKTLVPLGWSAESIADKSKAGRPKKAKHCLLKIYVEREESASHSYLEFIFLFFFK
jgi:hypothetical protein